MWYRVRTRINNREPLFRGNRALVIFAKVFNETMRRFAFEFCRLRVENDTLEFYIKPDDGLELPVIMKWLKQVFSQRYNHADGRVGHIWGDRYWSLIIEGEPPEGDAAEVERGGGAVFNGVEIGVRPQHRGTGIQAAFFLFSPFPARIAPGFTMRMEFAR